MRDTYDPRWDDDRRDVASDGRDVSRGSRGATDPRETEPVGARDVFSRGLRWAERVVPSASGERT